MRRSDILSMAVHNLRRRTARTLLNLLGIVVGCIVLLMTAAGVRGVKNAIHVLFDASESARQIAVIPSDYPSQDPPEEAVAVEEEMSDERRERIRDKLDQKWRSTHRSEKEWELTEQEIQRLESQEHIESVVPRVNVSCAVKLLTKTDSDDADSTAGSVTPVVKTSLFGIDPNSQLTRDRIIAGDMVAATDDGSCVLHEYTAYELGFRSDDELRQLVGKEIELEYRTSPGAQGRVFNLLLGKWGDLSPGELAQQARFIPAVKKVITELDKTSLTNEEKSMLKGLFAPSSPGDADKPQVIRRTFVVSGVIREGDASGIAQLFKGHWHSGYGGVAIEYHLASSIQLSTTGETRFYDAVTTVDSTKNLTMVSDSIESLGSRTYSAGRILDSMDNSIDESAWVVYGVALAILFTAAIGISNTLLVSVLERTPEFGIMKSVGARDSTLLWLMVCEGAILGLLGALIAVLLSFVVGAAGHRFLEMYLEYRLGGEIASTLFQFSFPPVAVVFLVSTAICVVASLFPAWRAARLDPVVAMQRS